MEVIMLITLIVIASLYALLHLLTGSVQLFKGDIPVQNAVLFVAGSLCMAVYLVFFTNTLGALALLAAGFLVIQLGAILNGKFMNGKVTFSHQLVRFVLMLVVVGGFRLVI